MAETATEPDAEPTPDPAFDEPEHRSPYARRSPYLPGHSPYAPRSPYVGHSPYKKEE